MSKTTCIYYDLKSINKEDIQAIIEKYDTEDTVHVHKDSIEFPGYDELKTETIGSERSSDYRNDLMKKTDLLFKEIRSLTKYEDVINNQGIDLLEIARYDFFFPMSYLVYPIWALEQIIERHRPETIIWVSSGQNTSIQKQKLREYLERKGITLINWSTQQIKKTNSSNNGKMLFWRIALSDIKKSLIEAFHCLTQKPYTQTTREYGEIDILFLENFPNSAKISASVAKELEDEKDISYCFVATNIAVLDVVSFLNKTLLIKSVLRPIDWFNIAYKQFRVSWLAFVIVEKLRSGQFINLREFGHLIDPTVLFSVAKTFRRATEMIINNTVLLTTLHPKVVATTSLSNSFSRAFAAVGNLHKISTFLIQHGFPAFDEYEDFMLQKSVLVWGMKDREQWLKRGYESDKVFVTGSPKFEDLANLENDSSETSTKGGPLKITYFPSLSNGSTISADLSSRALELVINTVNHLDNVLLTIKTKLADKISIRNIYNDFNSISVINDRDAIEVIQESDIILVTTSNVGLESCIVGKPLIVLDMPGLNVFSFYKDYDCALFASTEKELQGAIEKIVSDENLKRDLEKGRRLLIENVFNGCIPGSSKRIAKVLIEGLS